MRHVRCDHQGLRDPRLRAAESSALATHCMSRKLLDNIRDFGTDERAQDVVEYGMLIATIAMVVLLGVAAFGNEIRPWFEQLAGRITTVGT